MSSTIKTNGSNQPVSMPKNKTNSSAVSSTKSSAGLLLAVGIIVGVLLFIYFVHTDTNDLNLTIDKQLDKSTTDETLIEQMPAVAHNIKDTTSKPLAMMNSNTNEKIANIINTTTITNANTKKYDSYQLEHIKRTNATYVIFHRLSKTGTSTFMSIFYKYSGKNENIKYFEGLGRIRVNTIEEIGAYRPMSNSVLSRYLYSKLKKCYQEIENKHSNYSRCFINTQMPFVDNFEQMAKVTHLGYSSSIPYASNPFVNGKIQFMTFIRNPITRIQSFYYYIRGMGGHFPQLKLQSYYAKIENHKKQNISDPIRKPEAIIIRDMTKNYTFEQCIEDIKDASNELINTKVLSYDVERVPIEYEQLPRLDTCRLSMNYATQYYCGIDAIDCHPRHLTKQSLEKAIYNLDTYFSFVGLFEEYDISMKLAYKKFSYLFNPNIMTDLQTWSIKVKEAGDNYATRQHYGTFKHDKMSETDPLWIYLTSKNQLDMILYQHVKKRFGQIVHEYGLQ